jgi:hypothetical protein
MHPPRRGKPFRGWTLSRAVPHSRPTSATPLQVTAAKSLALAEHGGTIQSSSGLYIIVEGGSH